MKNLLFSLILGTFFIPGNIYSQQNGANISFDESVYDFGKIDESKGIVSHKFEFTNTGSEPLVIQNVATTCGCTTPSWTKAPVRPGEKGFVSAEFNPDGRPGQFEKFITVQSTANPPMVQLKIIGQVNPKILKIEEQYPFDFGGLRLKTNQVGFGTIFKGQQQTNFIEIINASDRPQTIKGVNIPPHIKVNIPVSTLAPKQTGIIEITFNTALVDEWGFVMNWLNISVNNITDRNSRIVVSTNIDEDFSQLTADQKAKAPVISFEDINFEIGTIKSGAKLDHEFKFTNTGKSNLIIRKIVTTCGCTAVIASEKVIAPGKSGVIKASFDSTGKTGKQNSPVTIITNDPANPKVMLWIKGEVLGQ